MIELSGGVILPMPKNAKGFKRPDDIYKNKWQTMKPEMWQRSYEHCLFSLFGLFGLPLHSVVPRMSKRMLEATDPMNVALRFMGEMELAGYVKFNRGFDERVVEPTKKLLALNVTELGGPDTAVTYPKLVGETIPVSPIRGGVSSDSNQEVSNISNVMAREKFTVNSFIFKVLQKVPPTEGSAYMLARTMKAAEDLLGTEHCYPFFLDSRSRMYTATTCGMNPQGSDHEKALSQPVYGEALTEAGFRALLEAAEGYSEKSWTANTMAYHARNWETNLEWLDADKPYSYLACADLIRSYLDNPEQPLPAFIPLDGRCSGLQHWSAVVRSSAITAHLGMQEEEHELDIYEYIADAWMKTLPRDLMYLATRKAAKVPVMTWGYNATRMTSMEHLGKMFGATQEWDVDQECYVTTGDGLERAVTGKLGCELYDCINDMLGPLTAAVEWVTEAAGIISSADNAEVHWITPDGFECMQRKVKGQRRQLKCALSNGAEFLLEILDFTPPIPNTAKHRSAIAPNIIHSLDATHLRMVARVLESMGLPMVFIHDSFATHCNYRDELYTAIVNTFADLYDMDYLAQLKAYWEERYSVELDPTPELGEWNPDSVRGLKRFFL
tara:strand:+ start:51 stop:1883 length:1833 start_codon:yes stop_codon:yes gene_type:complete